MRRLLVVLLFSVLAVFVWTPAAQGLSIKMQPLMYKDTLKPGEKKKGFVDISNPSPTTVRLTTSVQAFRQVNDQGSLQFFDSEQVSTGITPDLMDFEIGPRQVIRMYFLIDGAKLPSGDVFAALFVSTTAPVKSGVNGTVRVGTIFSLVNGTPGARGAMVTKLDVPFWQFGEGIEGSFVIKNTAREGTATGFFPSVTVALDPLHSQHQFESKLLFAGRSRQNEFEINSARFGFYKVSATYGQSTQEKWVFMLTGYWRMVVIIVIILLAVSCALWRAVQLRKP